MKTLETTPLEADEKEYKYYAPEVGLLIDSGLKLVKYGMKGQSQWQRKPGGRRRENQLAFACRPDVKES